MKFLKRITKRRLLVLLMLAAAVCSLLGSGPAARLRRMTYYVLCPLGDAGMYLAAAFKSQAGG